MGNSKSKQSSETTEREHHSTDNGVANEEDIEPEQLSYWQMIKHGYQELVNAIIRPPRCQYEISQLGPKYFDFCGKSFQRTDFDVTNERGLKVICSMWEPTPASRDNIVLPCVIYMHGNSSARPEALGQLSLVLSLGATLVTFDFCGSGMSDGEYVSLGYYEKDDLKVMFCFSSVCFYLHVLYNTSIRILSHSSLFFTHRPSLCYLSWLDYLDDFW